MKKRFLMILVAICAICMGLAISCAKTSGESTSNGQNGEQSGSAYAIEGVMDIALSTQDAEYDFLKGVVGWHNETLKEVSVDASAVKFGTVGAYEITYTLGDVSKKATVRVYGTPEIIGDEVYEAEFSDDIDVFAGLVGKDCFGVELEITTNQEFNRDFLGRIIYGEHNFRYYVTDAVGNVAYFDRVYTVNPPSGYVFDDVIVTAENPETKINIEGKELEFVLYNEQIVPASEYVIRDNVLDLSYFAVELGKGAHVFQLSFAGGYTNVNVDMQITPEQYYTRPIEGADMAWIFKPYYLNGIVTGNEVYWDEELVAYHFVNVVSEQNDARGFVMDHTYFNKIIEKGGAKTISFQIKYELDKSADSELGFYYGFMPGWWDGSFKKMQLVYFAYGWIDVTVDLSMSDKLSDGYKNLFLLVTTGGFHIRDIQIGR